MSESVAYVLSDKGNPSLLLDTTSSLCHIVDNLRIWSEDVDRGFSWHWRPMHNCQLVGVKNMKD